MSRKLVDAFNEELSAFRYRQAKLEPLLQRLSDAKTDEEFDRIFKAAHISDWDYLFLDRMSQLTHSAARSNRQRRKVV